MRKPHENRFAEAFRQLGLTEADKRRVIMVGNNIPRDIVGANRFGIRSVLLTWSPRYDMTPDVSDPETIPTYTIATPADLLDLAECLEENLK